MNPTHFLMRSGKQKHYDLLKGFGPVIIADFGKELKPLPKNVVGIHAPESIDHAPGGWLILDDGTEVDVRDFNGVIANFSIYGQRKMGRVKQQRRETTGKRNI